jgi:carboxylesterase
MVKRLVKFVGKAAGTAKNILFADPKLLYVEERHLVNKPFFFVPEDGKGNDKAILLVHGWTSTPYEVRRLGKFLFENGYTVLGIQLTGHGTVPKDLEAVAWEDWLGDVERGYAELKKTCDKVYIGGTSIGGDLALLFAEQQSDVAGLVVMATPFAMRSEKIALFLVNMMLRFKMHYRKKYYPPTFGLSTTITRLISYQEYPVKSVLEAFKIVREMRKNITKVTQPTLIMQSTHDHIVEKNSAENIYAGIRSEIKKKIYIEKAYHTFISDIKNEHIFEDILNFLEEN